MSLYSLVYVSIATKNMADYELLTLLQKSRENNTRSGITGLLLHRDGFFIQALEGEESALNVLFEKIKHDTRHYNVIELYREPLSNRHFGQWAMGFESPKSELLKHFKGFSDFMTAKPLGEFGKVAALMADDVQIMLNQFRH